MTRMGLVTFALAVIVIVGLWHLLVRTFAESHPDSGLAQAAARAW